MIVSKTYEIDSCDDVELDIKRESKLEFKLWYDDEKRQFNTAVVGVNYHCIGNRPQTGSSFFMDDIDKLILKASCEAHVSLQPTKNEYQNFGIMQAQDLLNAALYLKAHAPFDTMGGVYPLS